MYIYQLKKQSIIRIQELVTCLRLRPVCVPPEDTCQFLQTIDNYIDFTRLYFSTNLVF